MITYWMLYAVAVGLPVLLAASLGAAALRRHGRPERGVWLVGLVLTLLLPVLLMARPVGSVQEAVPTAAGEVTASAPPGGPAEAGLFAPNVLVVPRTSAGYGLDEALLLVWLLVSAGLVLRWAVSTRRLARASAGWRVDTVDGSRVWLTPDSGPAVTGVVRTRILVPDWLLALPGDQRSLVMLHEAEHLRARDPWLMTLCRVARIVTPWNPVVWLMSARLLHAVELDCDRRVLGRCPDVRSYCDTLFAISARRPNRLIGAAAFAEPRIPLQKRIVAMTTPQRTMSSLTVMLLLALGGLLVLGSCGVPLPTVEDAEVRASVVDNEERAAHVSVDSDGQVTVHGIRVPMEAVSDILDDLVEAAADPLVTYVYAERDVPYRYVVELQGELIDAGAVRVGFEVSHLGGVHENTECIAIVLPEDQEMARVSGRNVLSLTALSSGAVEVRRGESESVDRIRPRDAEELWRGGVASNANLIAAVKFETETTYEQVMDLMDALYRANASRVARRADGHRGLVVAGGPSPRRQDT